MKDEFSKNSPKWFETITLMQNRQTSPILALWTQTGKEDSPV